jgi:hypothetical protein
MMMPSSAGGCSSLNTFPMHRQASLQQPFSLQVTPSAAGFNSPLSGSNGSNEVDPAVLELEHYMMQELAAAGMAVNDGSSATRLPTVMVPVVAAPTAVPHQPMWHHAALPLKQQPQPQQLQQQQHVADVKPVMQHQLMHQMRPHQPMQHQLQPPPVQQQVCHTLAAPPQHWHNAPSGTSSELTACYTLGAAAPAAAGGMWVPAGACGGNMSSLSAAATAPHQQQQQGMMRVSPGPAPGCAGGAAGGSSGGGRGGSSSRSEMMARLHGRLHVLQSQMEDMQLMLGLLQGGC